MGPLRPLTILCVPSTLPPYWTINTLKSGAREVPRTQLGSGLQEVIQSGL